MKKIILILTAAITSLLFTVLPAPAQGVPDKNEEAARLRGNLAEATSTQDSVMILADIFDLTPRTGQPAVALEIFDLVERVGDHTTRLNILRLLTDCFRKDEAFRKLEEEVMKVPDSKEQKETLLFVKMKRIVYAPRFMDGKQRQTELVNLLSELDTPLPENNPGPNGLPPSHERLLRLFTVVEYLRNEATGTMLKDYLDKLIWMAESNQFTLNALDKLIYSEAAAIYTDAGEEEKAVSVDRKLLSTITRLKDAYKKNNRQYRDYDMILYAIYYRMMRNFEALSAKEIRSVHDEVMKLAERNPKIRSNIKNNPGFRAYYSMATADYAAAIPLLRGLIRRADVGTRVRKEALEHIILAADKTGDLTAKLEALTEYNVLLDEISRLRSEEKYKELQIRYDVQDLKSRNTELRLNDKKNQLKSRRRLILFVAIAFVVMALLLLLTLGAWVRFRRNSGNLGDLVDLLHNERHRLRRTLYLDDGEEPDDTELAEFEKEQTWSKRIKRNRLGTDTSSLLVKSLVNDLLYVASMGRDEVMKYIEPVSVDSLLRKIEAEAGELTAGRGDFIVEYPEDDFRIRVDSQCMIAVVSHALEVASRFTESHKVNVGVRRQPDGYIDFIITIDRAGKASTADPQILQDFIDADKILGNRDSGMLICRLVAFLLRSRHFVDRTYKHGTRYVFRFVSNATLS